MFFMTHLYRLQSITQFEIQSNPADTIGFVITFTALIALIVFMNVSKRIKNSAVFKGKGIAIKTKAGPKIDGAFYNKVKFLGISKNEAYILEKTLRSNGGDPYTNLLSDAKVDENFKLAYKKILREKRADDAQAELLELFSVRNTVELYLSSERNSGKEALRNFRRKITNINCKFYLVLAKDEPSKGKKKLVLQNGTTYMGIIQNISQGGCAIMTPHVLKINTLIKIEFSVSRHSGAALGQIVRINREAGISIYHIKFLKLSKQTILDINEFIFDYG
ncbi:MAG: PilZ domain-containing protein [Spirochaetaceae bacterium]|jgi:hypothetical protein|nr:PilZ domain-containing protein [Spirochaetaceae bacterium]